MTQPNLNFAYPVYCIDGPLKDYRFQVHTQQIETLDIFGTWYKILWEGGAQEFPYPYPEKYDIPEGYPKTFTAYAATWNQVVINDPA